MKYRKCSSERLKELNRIAMGHGYNRQLDPHGIERRIDPQGIHVLYPLMTHSHAAGRTVDPHVRARVLLKLRGTYEPTAVQLDIPVLEWDKLEVLDEVEAERLVL